METGLGRHILDLECAFESRQAVQTWITWALPPQLLIQWIWGYGFAGAAVTKHHKWSSFNNRNVWSHSSEAKSPRSRFGWERSGQFLGAWRENLFHSILQAAAGWRASLVFLGLQMHRANPWSSCSHGIHLVCMSVSRSPSFFFF